MILNAESVDHSHCRVMIVDDNPEVLESVSIFLEDSGYTVLQAAAASDGLEMIEQQHPDIGIVDMRLPGMDGSEFIERAHALHVGMRFIIHTGSMAYQLPESLAMLGITQDDVLIKPVIDMARLIEVIERLQQA